MYDQHIQVLHVYIIISHFYATLFKQMDLNPKISSYNINVDSIQKNKNNQCRYTLHSNICTLNGYHIHMVENIELI